MNMIDISTENYRLLKRRAPGLLGWEGEQAGPTQKIFLEDDMYCEFVDRAIAHRQTLDQVVGEFCHHSTDKIFPAPKAGTIKPFNTLN